ncbi:TPA: hypothetical protein ACLXTN_001379 [Streptococcus pneumoniae]|nr:Uncharacterised protein [Streptococcus pneumoniae]VRD27159.1 Uncharacterised protein [Streptococcus pneumoniae]VRH96699.1 Uncharacterised protein [Streptococcus pneumoniae]
MEDEQNILEIQLILGKQVLEIVLDLLKDDSKTGVVLQQRSYHEHNRESQTMVY